MIRMRAPQDVMAGLMFIAIGLLALSLVRGMPVGTALRMGPAYIPMLLGWTLILLGAIVAGGGLLVDGPPLEGWALRPLLIILGSIIVFGLLIENAGLAAASIGLMLVSTIAAPDRRWGESILFAVGITVMSILLFKNLLGLPLQVIP